MTNKNHALFVVLGLIVALGMTGCQSSGDSQVDGEPVTDAEPTQMTEPSETADSGNAEETSAPSSTTDSGESADAGEFAPEDINGRLCAAPDSPADDGCITVEWPNATFDSGAQAVTLEVMNESAEGCVVISQGDAPFGDFCVAGTELPLPSESFSGADYPDQDRIWNSQIGWMYLRE